MRPGKAAYELTIHLHVPSWIKKEHIAHGCKLLKELFEKLGEDREARLGWLYCANRDGFPIRPLANVDDQELEQLIIRAFWWAFEQQSNGVRFPSQELH